MVGVELLFHAATLVVALVVLGFVGIAYYRTRIRRLLIPFLLATLLGMNMVIEFIEEFSGNGVSNLELLVSLLSLGIGVLLLVTVFRQFPGNPR